ncbi:DUF1611 domain-containing protein [Promicromonospora iranensis]|uniref:DUF1611 domain-containing protein n=1 Tax=Promicromonospora iranensis TaxID=1105144 RepID=A0ABU2CN04_9MICO|nr:DUF1611 domain-containing protein [Promicromonospora iranensis]MDR7382702.1 hypothetical protein [Promicromonospora iranensis]
MSILDTSPGLRGYAPRPVATPLRADVAGVASRTPDPLVRRLLRAKKAYSTRFVAAAIEADPAAFGLVTDLAHPPRPGDVVLARVVTIGQHKRLESPVSRRQILFEGDEIVVSYGSRYAADQFHAVIPEDLGPCHLAAGGGLASRVVDQHASIQDATVIEPIGLLSRANRVVNLSAFAPHPVRAASRVRGAASRVPVVAVVGTSMNSGKSTVLACLARGLTAAGLTVHAGKATGTGAGNDANHYTDAGAARVVDFTDFGLPSTFGLSFEEVRDVFATMTDVLASPAGHGAPDVVLVEIADGIFQGDTSRLLTDAAFRSVVDRVVFAAGDALGASGGIAALGALGCLPSVVSGVLTASPLATAEARAALDVEVVPTFDLCLPSVALTAAGLAPAGRTGAGHAVA